MKKILLLSVLTVSLYSSQAQGLKGLIKKATKDTTVNRIIGAKSVAAGLSNDEIISGLKEALSVGTGNGTKSFRPVNGFFR
jgi:hypothetical protein